MSAHTPGPWLIEDFMVYCDDSLGSRVADCRDPGHGIARAQAEANVRLIAAAPDLLEAARDALAELYRVSPSRASPKLRAAIAKATEFSSNSDLPR